MATKVFDNNRSRLRNFFLALVAFTLIVPIQFIIRSIGKKGFGSLFSKSTLIWFVGSFVLGLIFAVYSAVKTPHMRITVSASGVDVVKGKAHGVYPVEDFIRVKRDTRNSGRSVSVLNSLVFRGEDDDLYIDCLGFSDKEFNQIADAISRVKHKDEEVDPPDTSLISLYEGTFDNSKVKKSFRTIFVFFGVMFVIEAAGTVFLVSIKFDRTSAILLFFETVEVICFLILLLVTRAYLRRTDRNTLRTLRIETFALKINDDVINYTDIRSIDLTPPYLVGTEAGRNRNLIIKTVDGKHEYIAGSRPSSDSTDDSKYNGLYNSLYKLSGEYGFVFNADESGI